MATFEEADTANFFQSYDNISVHNLMLRDKPRVEKYREAIFKSKDTFRDKIVLDCGSGTGVLSMFAAQAGAKKVYAVEASNTICELSRAIIAANKLSDTIEVIHGEIEKVELPVDKVDIIISEWMGFYLVHEGMLGSVLFARDKWLKAEGCMYPSMAYLYACPIEMHTYLTEHLTYWSNYYNLDYEPMMKVYRQLLLEKPIIENIDREQLLEDEKILVSFDLKTIKAAELESIQAYNMEFCATRDGHLHGFAFWFDVVFNTDEDVVTLSTGPASEPTHWKQTIALLPEALDAFAAQKKSDDDDSAAAPPTTSSLQLKEDQSFECFIIMNQSDENARNYQIDIGVNLEARKASDDDEEASGSCSDGDDEHPMPCDCGKMRCLIVKATLAKYENEAKESA